MNSTDWNDLRRPTSWVCRLSPVEGGVLRWAHQLLDVLPPVEIFSGVTSPGFFQLEAAAAPLEG